MELSLLDATLIPVIVGLVEAIKRAGLATRWLPFVAIILGVVGVWVLNGNAEWLAGIAIGLSAVGLFSGTKATVGN